MEKLTESVANSLNVSENEADKIIDEQASIGRDLLSDGDLTYGDVEELMYDMGIEPDHMEEFLERMI